MFKVSPLGLSVTKILAGLLIAEALVFATGRLISRSQAIILPPQTVGDWTVSPGNPPISDYQRGNPDQISVVYSNGDKPAVHVDIAAVQSLDCLRLPQKYMEDSDGRINPTDTQVVKHRNRNAYTLSATLGIETSDLVMHWFQRPGSSPIPTPAEGISEASKVILFGFPRFYVCDVWVEIHPGINWQDTKKQLQLFADTLSDQIKSSH